MTPQVQRSNYPLLFMIFFMFVLLYSLSVGGAATDVDHLNVDEVRAAAAKGDSEALYQLGILYAKGQDDIAKDDEQALQYFLKAAEDGHAKAQFSVGNIYDNGLGVAKNPIEAFKWFQKSAENNYVTAQFNVAIMYYHGQTGKKDYEKAFHWYRKAAMQGHVESQYNVGIMYGKGQGVTKDTIQAYAWWSQPSVLGFKSANENRHLISQYMTPAQIKKAKEIAAEISAQIENNGQ